MSVLSQSRSPTLELLGIAVAVAAAEALIVLLCLHQGSVAPIGGDSVVYNLLAQNLVDGHGLSTSTHAPFEPAVWRSPGYPAFLAALKLVGLGSTLAVRIVQFLLLALTAFFAGKTAERAFDMRTARVATVLVATTLPLVWASTWHMSEALAAFGLMVAIYLLVRARGADAWDQKTLAFAGLALAATIYVRPTLLILVVVIAVGIAIDSNASGLRRLLPGAVFGLACVLAIAPWTVRNHSHTGDVIPVETGRGPTLLVSAHQYAGDLGVTGKPDDLAALVRVTRDASRKYRLAGFTARQQVQADKAAAKAAPWGRVTAIDVAKQVPERLMVMLGPIPRSTTLGVSGETLLERTALVQGALALLLAILGLAALPSSLRRLWPIWIAPLTLALMHLVLHVEPRYAIPQRPELMVLAALGLVVAYDYVRRRASEPAPSV
jgi:4-amino-4-deoxy-L-arabinose transferase-like glycosyltransferase